MTTETLHSAPASVDAQPAREKRIDDISMLDAPLLHPDKLFSPRTPDSFAERPLRGAGSLATDQVFACEKYHDDIRKQIMYLCECNFPAATGRSRPLGDARRAATRDTLMHLVHVLDECADQSKDPSLRLRNTEDFGTHHLLAILRSFAHNKVKRSTVHNQLSVLRKFLTLLGRRDLIPCTDELAMLAVQHDIALNFGSRSYTAYVPLAWSAIVDVERVLQQIHDRDAHAHLLCEVMEAFGLRRTEVIRLRPAESDLGDRLWVCRGTKGNRERWIAFSMDPERRAWQRSVLDRAKAACGGDHRRHLGFGDRTLEQAIKYFQSVLEHCGVTQRDLGIKIHGLRHQYALQRFFELTGLPAPVLRQAPLSAYKDRMDLVRHAQRQIAAELGHGRISVVCQYIGSLPTLREEANQTKLAGEIIAQHRAELEELGVSAVTVAVRKTAARRHTCTLYLRAADDGHVAGQATLVARVRERARAWLGRKIDALLVTAPAQAGTVTISVKHA